jgi:predicted RNA binding protein YcfA (HicA-like mRNA interferase family)
MSQWPSAKAKRVFSALLNIGWEVKRQSGLHRTLSREVSPPHGRIRLPRRGGARSCTAKSLLARSMHADRMLVDFRFRTGG